MPVFVWISVYICKFRGHAPVVFIGGKHFFFLLPRWHARLSVTYRLSSLSSPSLLPDDSLPPGRRWNIFGAIFSSSPIGYLQKSVLPKVFIFVCFHWLLCWFAIHEGQLQGEIDSFYFRFWLTLFLSVPTRFTPSVQNPVFVFFFFF